MAYKSFSKLTTRNQGTLVSQIHKLIKYYIDFFVPRDRIYIKNLSKIDGTIYWVEDNDHNLTAMALIEPEHCFELKDVTIKTVGHLISRKMGFLERVLKHLWEDYEADTMIVFMKPQFAHTLTTEGTALFEFSPSQLLEHWPELGLLRTAYFNVKNEILHQGMDRKNNHLFLKIGKNHEIWLQNHFPKAWDFIKNK